MITGRSASSSSASARSRAAPSASAERGAGTSAISSTSASMKTTSSGKSRNTGPVCGRRATANASSTRPGISGVAPAVAASLTTRPHERHVVDLLQRPLAPAERRRAAAEHDDRRVVLQRGRHPAHPVGHARPGGQRGDARLARDLRPALGGERRGRLVADVDDLDALVAAALVDREEMAAGEREQAADAVRLQALGDQAAAVVAGRLVSHGGAESIPPARGVAPPAAAGTGGADRSSVQEWPNRSRNSPTPTSTCSCARPIATIRSSARRARRAPRSRASRWTR